MDSPNTKDQDALGLVLPATVEHQGYQAEKEKGNIKILPAGESIVFKVEAGLIKPEEVEKVRKKIDEITERG